jgi:hypothetical protein
MATQTINFTEEAAKVAAAFAAFQSEIKRLTLENQELQAKLAGMQMTEMVKMASDWEVPPSEINPIPVTDLSQAVTEQHQSIKNKRRGPNKPAEAATRCHALIPCIEMNGNGELLPAQCKRSSEDNAGFCKQHADHQNYGTVEEPNNELLVKNHEHMMKAFNKKNGIVEMKKKKSKAAVKRALNPYMMFLAVNRDRVKEELLAENPELKGRALAMAITSTVGRLWQASKGCDIAEVSDDSSECSDCSQSESEIERELDEMLGVSC